MNINRRYTILRQTTAIPPKVIKSMERTLKVKVFSENLSHPRKKTKQSKINKNIFSLNVLALKYIPGLT